RRDDPLAALAAKPLQYPAAAHRAAACSSVGYCSRGTVARLWIAGSSSESGNTPRALPTTLTLTPPASSLIEALRPRAALPPAASTCRVRSSPAAAPLETAVRA